MNIPDNKIEEAFTEAKGDSKLFMQILKNKCPSASFVDIAEIATKKFI